MHPVTAKAYDIPETYVAELNLSAIEAALQPAAPFVKSLNSQQLAVTLPPSPQGRSHSPRSCGRYPAVGVKRLTDIKLFDVFSGEKLGLGMKSMAYSLTFQNPEDSLTDEEVARYMEKIQASLEEKVNAEVR